MALKRCYFRNCTNNSNNSPNVLFHQFTKNNRERWISACKKDHLKDVPLSYLYRSHYVCGDHFLKYDYKQILSQFGKKLKLGVTPRAFTDESNVNIQDLLDKYEGKNIKENEEKKEENEPLYENKNFWDSEAETSYCKKSSRTKTETDLDEIQGLIHDIDDLNYSEDDMEYLSLPIMVSEGTQTNEDLDYKENIFSLFCCTFHNDNEVETFCHLTNTDLPIQSSYQINKFRKSNKKRNRELTKKADKYIEMDDINIELIQSDNNKINIEDKSLYFKKSKDGDYIGYITLENTINNDEISTLPGSSTKKTTKSHKANYKRFRRKEPKKFPSDLCTKCDKRSNQFLCRRIANHLDNVFECKFCKGHFESLNLLESHVKNYHPEELRPFTCSFCKRVFEYENRYHFHTTPTSCWICNVSFNCLAEFRKHKKIYHRALPRYKCIHCEKDFKYELKLAMHNRLSHCSVCLKSFECKTWLKKHRVIHYGKKPSLNNYTCSICSKNFKRLIHLNDHMRLHTGEKPFLCDLCGATFSHNGSLHSHIHRTHREFSNLGKLSSATDT